MHFQSKTIHFVVKNPSFHCTTRKWIPGSDRIDMPDSGSSVFCMSLPSAVNRRSVRGVKLSSQNMAVLSVAGFG